MTIQTIKLKNKNLTLPKSWVGQEVFVQKTEDTIIIKKIGEKNFWKTWEKMRSIAKSLKKKDIQEAILWARNKQKK